MAEQQMSEEQIQALQEKIKNMSPEELKDFQKKQCIFCQIISGRVQSKKIYEDDKCLGILDINPANPGHILLLPKEHYTIMPQVPEEEISHIFNVAKSLSNAQLRGIGAQGTNILVANGVAAGQRAQHFMVHVIPRMEKDNVPFTLPQKTLSEDQLEDIRKKLAKTLGVVDSETQSPPQLKRDKVVEGEFEEKEGSLGENLGKETDKKEDKKEDSQDNGGSEKGEVEKKDEDAHEVEENSEEKEKDNDEPNLDDIANLLGAK